MKNKEYIREDYGKTLKFFSKGKDSPEIPGNSEAIEKYRKLSGLKETDFFYDAFLKAKSTIPEKEKKPVAGYFCNTVPEELLLACGVHPVRLCSADSHCAECGEEAIPGDICPMVKAACGDFFHDFNRMMDLLIIPATCDGRVKLAEILSPVAKDIYFIDIPRNTDYLENVNIWEKEYTKFFDYLKSKFKVKPARREILDACIQTKERTRMYRKIYEARAKKPGIMNAFDYFIMANSSFFLSPAEWTEKASLLYGEISGREQEPGRKKILLAGSPVVFPNFKILDILGDAGCCVSADVVCSAYGRLYDPVEIDEETESGIIRALSLKYVAPSICPCFVGIDKLINTVLDSVERYGLDGVIYYNIRLCQVFEMASGVLRSVLKDRDIPFLFLKTDFSKEDTGQLKTRVEAFMEMLG